MSSKWRLCGRGGCGFKSPVRVGTVRITESRRWKIIIDSSVIEQALRVLTFFATEKGQNTAALLMDVLE